MARRLSDAAKERQYEAQKAWHKENTERLSIAFRKGELDRYRRMAAGRGVSLSSVVKELLIAEYKKEYGPMDMRKLGTADVVYSNTGDREVDVWETAEGRRYCVSEWNGEAWLECWEVFSDLSAGPSFKVTPVYRYEKEEIDLSKLEENSPEWDRAVEIIGLDF